MSELSDPRVEVEAERPLAELAEEICATAARIAAATARWLGLVAEFDLREGWAEIGVKSCAHWLGWQCGLSPNAAREHVRVARALSGLPGIAAAFTAGSLSYSKVRAITRVADADTEADLLEVGLAGTAAHVEKIVRGWRRADLAEEPEEDTSRFGLSIHWDEDGSLRVAGRLSAEDGAMLLTALQAVAERVDSERAESERADSERAGAERAGAERADFERGDFERGDFERGDFERAGAERGDFERADTERGDTERAGTGPVHSAEPGSQRRSQPAASPGRDVAEDGRPRPCSQAEALLEIARTFLDPDPARRSAAARHQVVVHVDADVLAADTAAGAAHLDGGPALSAEQVARIGCDASLVVMLRRGRDVLDVGRATRTIPTSINRALWARDGGCRFPGCHEDRRARVQGHHIRFWSRGGRTAMSNLVLLCGFHHSQIHHGGFTVTMNSHGRPTFADPHGRRLDQCPQPLANNQPLPAATGELLPTWSGEQLDLDYAIHVLLSRRDHVRQQPADRGSAAAA